MKLVCTILLLFIAGCTHPVVVHDGGVAPGTVTLLDEGGAEGDTGWWPSVAFDASGQPHVVYCDAYHGDLKHAYRRGQQWHIENIVTQGAVGKYAALAVAPNGTLGVAFYDQTRKYLRYAWRTPLNRPRATDLDGAENGWRSERIAWGTEVGMAAELRFDANDEAHLFYYVPSGTLVHGHRSSTGVWDKHAIAKATGSFSVRIDALKTPVGFAVSFVDWTFKKTILHVAQGLNNTWEIETISDEHSPGWRSQLLQTKDQQGQLSVLFSTNVKPALRYAERRQDAWVTRVLAAHVGNFDAARRSLSEVFVAYEDTTYGASGDGVIRLLKFNPTNPRAKVTRWTLDTSGPTGAYLDMAINTQGRLLLAYYDGALRGIKVYEERLF